jgi:ribonuclease BN (tRNA processing enzyme)
LGFSFKDIFFTHYHSDHMLGVIGLFRTMGLMDRNEPVTLYGPRGADRILRNALAVGIERTKFPFEIVEVKPGDRLGRGEYEIAVFETEHSADTVGYALVEHDRLGASIRRRPPSLASRRVRSGARSTRARRSRCRTDGPSRRTSSWGRRGRDGRW